MKRYLLLSAFAFLALSSCTRDEKVFLEDEEKSGISLTLVCAEPTLTTKADPTKPGEERYNENDINTIDYFFYPNGAGTEQNSVYHNRVSGINGSESYTLQIPVDAGLVNNVLFPGNERFCQVAVIINYPEEINHLDPNLNCKLSDIMALPLNTDFKGSTVPAIQPQFVMFGTATVELLGKSRKVVAEPIVDMRRVASKVTVDLHVKDRLTTYLKKTLGGQEHLIPQYWVPKTDTDNLKVYLQWALRRAVLSGDFSALTDINPSQDYFKYKETPFTGATTRHTITYYEDELVEGHLQPVQHTEEFDFMVSNPFYTYPRTWTDNDEYEPYIKIVLPWVMQAGSYIYTDEHGVQQTWSWGSRTKQYYYRVVLPNKSTGFVSNNWYHLIMEVGVFGSELDDEPLDIEGLYYVEDWKSNDDIGIDVKRGRYLSVSRTVDTMYNTTNLVIPFVTSHPCEIEPSSVVIKQFDYSIDKGNNEYGDYKYFTSPTTDGWITLQGNTIVINHTLNNDITKDNFDASPYEFTFKIKHQDDDDYSQIVTIIQYPALYIKSEKSNGYVFIRGENNGSNKAIWDSRGSNTSNANKPYAYMGSLINRNDAIGRQGENNNPYQYTIYVTVLPDESGWSIGDPRGAAISGRTPANNTTNPLYNIEDLLTYKPTDADTKDIIAPVFKIASSYGKTSSMTYEGAVKRCATYQEYGYPPGRWRLPTKAEIEFLITLSDKEKIPLLFSPDETSGYWGGGKIFLYKPSSLEFMMSIPNNATIDYRTNGNGRDYRYTFNNSIYYVYTRCVYDVWYWGDKKWPGAEQSWAEYQP